MYIGINHDNVSLADRLRFVPVGQSFQSLSNLVSMCLHYDQIDSRRTEETMYSWSCPHFRTRRTVDATGHGSANLL
jgi:hypothetical protein